MKKFFALVFGVFTLSVMSCVPVFAEYWNEGNDGKSWKTAYVIDSVKDFQDMMRRADVLERGLYYKLTSDLNITTWSMNNSWSGHFDGQNHTINVSIDRSYFSSGGSTGLFNTIRGTENEISVRNLKITGSFKGNSASALANKMNAGIIENCSFNGTVECTKEDGAGGFLVFMDGGVIRNCTVKGKILNSSTGSGSRAGGFVCSILSGDIEHCIAESGTEVSGAYSAGGIAGSMVYQGSYGTGGYIKNCKSNAVISNGKYRGGILGQEAFIEANSHLLYNTWPKQYPEIGNSSSDEPNQPATSEDKPAPTPDSGDKPSNPDTPNTPNTLSTNNHRYQVFNRSMTWTEAKAYCESLGGHLATITSQEEQDYIISMLSDDKKFYWLGASDNNTEGKWQWVTGETFTFTNWLPGEPNGTSRENYLILTNYYYNQWGWNDGTIDAVYQSMYGFICEWDTANPNPNTPDNSGPTNDINQPTTSGLPPATIQAVSLSRDVLEKIAQAVNVDVSQLYLLTDGNISATREPTQAMRDYAKNDNTELIGKLNTIEVDKSGYYVFKVTLGDELWEKVKNGNISDFKFYGLSDSDAKVSAAFINGLLGTCEILTLKGEKLTSFGIREFLMVAFLNAGTPFTMFLAKLIMAILGGGCTLAGIGLTGFFAAGGVIMLRKFFRKH